ncbi:MAG: Gfo/Idh/MocA family oxidoreductase [Pseudomonadota bacterium]
MSTDPLRVGVLGAGYFAQFHHEAWERLTGAHLVAIADKDLARAESAAEGLGAEAHADLESMLATAELDLLDIASPPPSHLPAIRAGLDAGVRALICQKPFCGDMTAAEEATALAEAAGIPLIVHENFRFQPWYRCIKRAIDAGRIGALHQASFRLRTGDGQGPRAYLDRQPYFQTMPRLLVHETAVHWLDTFRYLLGEPEWVFADLRRMNPVIAGEDAAHLLLGFDGGVRALFDGNRLLDHAAENHRLTLGEALVEGSDGTLTLTGDGAVQWRAFGAVETETLLAPQDWPGFAGDCVHALKAHVLAALTGEGAFENTARTYLQVMRMEAAAYRSAETGRREPL